MGGLDVLVCDGLFEYYVGLDALEPEVFDAAFDEAMRVRAEPRMCEGPERCGVAQCEH